MAPLSPRAPTVHGPLSTELLEIIFDQIPYASLLSCLTVCTRFYLLVRPLLFKKTLHAAGPFGGRGKRPVFRRSWLTRTRMVDVTFSLEVKTHHRGSDVKLSHLVPVEAMPALEVVRVTLESPDWDTSRYHYPQRSYPWAAIQHLRPRTVVIRGCNVMHQELLPALSSIITDATTIIFVTGPSTNRVWNFFKSFIPSPKLTKLAFVMLSNRATPLLGWEKVYEDYHWTADDKRLAAANRLLGDFASFCTRQGWRDGAVDLSLDFVRFNPTPREAFNNALFAVKPPSSPSNSSDSDATPRTLNSALADAAATPSIPTEATPSSSNNTPTLIKLSDSDAPDGWIDLVAAHLPRVIIEDAEDRPWFHRDPGQFRKTHFRYLDTLSFLTSDDYDWEQALDLKELEPWHDHMDEEDRLKAEQEKKWAEERRKREKEMEPYYKRLREERAKVGGGRTTMRDVRKMIHAEKEKEAEEAKKNQSTSGNNKEKIGPTSGESKGKKSGSTSAKDTVTKSESTSRNDKENVKPEALSK